MFLFPWYNLNSPQVWSCDLSHRPILVSSRHWYFFLSFLPLFSFPGPSSLCLSHPPIRLTMNTLTHFSIHLPSYLIHINKLNKQEQDYLQWHLWIHSHSTWWYLLCAAQEGKSSEAETWQLLLATNWGEIHLKPWPSSRKDVVRERRRFWEGLMPSYA